MGITRVRVKNRGPRDRRSALLAYFLHPNALHSDAQLTDHTGTVQMDLLYYPLGQVWQTGGSMLDAHFAGFQQGAGTNYTTPTRGYGNSLGRWLTPDPALHLQARIANPQSLNLYSYSLNNPGNLVDPNGKWPSRIHNEIIDRAFPGLSSGQRNLLKAASARVDDPFHGGLNAETAYKHSMSSGAGPDSQAFATDLASDWIKSKESEATSKQDSYEKQGGVGVSNGALDSFGNALHTVSDATSPTHEGFQVWDPSDLLGMFLHIALESSISDAQMNRAVDAERDAFLQTFGPDRLRQATNCRSGDPICDQAPPSQGSTAPKP